MTPTLAFDIYGTLIDTQGMVGALQPLLGDRAAAFSQAWRDKQLEYAFRRGLMQNYVDFATCTRQALDYTCAVQGVSLTAEQRTTLLDGYRRLPAFADVGRGLAQLEQAGLRLYAFSNGTVAAVDELLRSAGIADHFIDIVSVDEQRSFKPNPAVYCRFLRRAGAIGAETWLVSSNPFDVIGALSAGLQGAWVRRSAAAVFDPWEFEPTLAVNDLLELAARLPGRVRGR